VNTEVGYMIVNSGPSTDITRYFCLINITFNEPSLLIDLPLVSPLHHLDIPIHIAIDYLLDFIIADLHCQVRFTI